MKDIEKLSFGFTIQYKSRLKMSTEDIDKEIAYLFARAVSIFLEEHLKELPIRHDVTRNHSAMAEEHRMSFYIISEDKLKRLIRTEDI